MSTIKLSQVLEKALAKLNGGKNWTQGTFVEEVNGERRYCALGALDSAAAELVPDGLGENRNIASSLLLLGSRSGYSGVVGFNDGARTTYADVEKAYKRAIIAAKASEDTE